MDETVKITVIERLALNNIKIALKHQIFKHWGR